MKFRIDSLNVFEHLFGWGEEDFMILIFFKTLIQEAGELPSQPGKPETQQGL